MMIAQSEHDPDYWWYWVDNWWNAGCAGKHLRCWVQLTLSRVLQWSLQLGLALSLWGICRFIICFCTDWLTMVHLVVILYIWFNNWISSY